MKRNYLLIVSIPNWPTAHAKFETADQAIKQAKYATDDMSLRGTKAIVKRLDTNETIFDSANV